MHDFDNSIMPTETETQDQLESTPQINEKPDLEDKNNSENILEPEDTEETNTSTNKEFLHRFFHVIQFCFLCFKGKVTPVHFSTPRSIEISKCFTSQKASMNLLNTIPRKQSTNLRPVNDTSDTDTSSLNMKISRKDQHLIHTMLKINETINRNTLKASKDQEEKEPGYHRLEQHKKNFILNASAVPQYGEQATSLTKFYLKFLAKKS
jgi:hypothetical protein